MYPIALTAAGSDVTGALTTAFSGIADQAVAAITAMVPVVAPIIGAGLVIGLGIKAFKKFSK